MPLIRFLGVHGPTYDVDQELHPEVDAITTPHGFFQRRVATEPPRLELNDDDRLELVEQPHEDAKPVRVSQRVADALMAMRGVEFEVVKK